MECRINTVPEANSIGGIDEAAGSQPILFFNTAGIQQKSLQPGINIIRTADGKTRKVLIK